jgi:hypothetical protein
LGIDAWELELELHDHGSKGRYFFAWTSAKLYLPGFLRHFFGSHLVAQNGSVAGRLQPQMGSVKERFSEKSHRFRTLDMRACVRGERACAGAPSFHGGLSAGDEQGRCQTGV